jgi:hypothetical protein
MSGIPCPQKRGTWGTRQSWVVGQFEEVFPQGLKPSSFIWAFAAGLKSSPDTERLHTAVMPCAGTRGRFAPALRDGVGLHWTRPQGFIPCHPSSR